LSVFLFLGHCIVCLFSFGPLYCLSFFFWAIVLFVFLLLGHCIVRLSSFEPLYCLSFFFWAIVLSVFLLFTASDYRFSINKRAPMALTIV
jgi:hypothetical protein